MCYIGSNTSEDADEDDTQNVNKTKTNVIFPRIVNSGNDYYVEDGTVDSYNENHEGSELGDDVTDKDLTRLQPSSVSIDSMGQITAITKDQQLVVVGFIAVGMVDNPNGVTHVDGRYYSALGGAGNLSVNTVGGAFTHIPPTGDDEVDEDELALLGSTKLTIESAGGTEFITGGLESSGTDLAQEITNMIVIQRGYQANTRVVTVTDSMLEELVNMKR